MDAANTLRPATVLPSCTKVLGRTRIPDIIRPEKKTTPFNWQISQHNYVPIANDQKIVSARCCFAASFGQYSLTWCAYEHQAASGIHNNHYLQAIGYALFVGRPEVHEKFSGSYLGASSNFFRPFG